MMELIWQFIESNPVMTVVLTPLALLVAYAILTAAIAALVAAVAVPIASSKAFGYGVRAALASVLRWFGLFWLSLIVEIAAILLTPFVTLFANHKTGRLPRGFLWMETHDALLPGYPAAQGFDRPYPASWWAWYRQAVSWLYRNRIYRFSTEVMGMPVHPLGLWRSFGPTSFDKTKRLQATLCLYLAPYDIPHGPLAWEIAVYIRLPKNTRFDLRIGYKLRNTWKRSGTAQHVVRIRPIAAQ